MTLSLLIWLSKRIPTRIPVIGSIKAGEDISRISVHFEVKPNSVVASISLVAATCFAALALLSFLVTSNILLSLSLGFCAAYLSYFLSLNSLESQIDEEMMLMTREGSRFLEEIRYGQKYSSLTEAMRDIVKADHPALSGRLLAAMHSVVNGTAPEKALAQSTTHSQTPASIERAIRVLITPQGAYDKNARFLTELPEEETRTLYREISEKMESKIIVFLGFSLFSPMFFLLALGLLEIPTTLAYLYIPLHSVLMATLFQRTLRATIQ